MTHPLSSIRRWTAGAMLATTLGVGAVGYHLAEDHAAASATSSTSGSTTSATTTDSSSTDSSSSDSSSSDSSSSDSSSSDSWGTVPQVASGGSAQSSTSGS